MKITNTLLIAFMMIGTANANSSPKYHSHDDITKTVEIFLKENLQRSNGIEINTKIRPLDNRLTLTKCEQPLSAFTSSNINQNPRFSVGIKCSGQKPWSLYVAVNVEKIASLYVTSSPLSRGDVITRSKIQLVKRDINKLRRGYYRNKNELLGMVAKRSLRAGIIISSHHLTLPMIIKKGDSVDIIAKTSAILIRMQGKAMADGAKGQRIRVKNNSSKKIISAVVITTGVVKVRI